MRKEHKPHVVVILLMMLLILAAFTFVILNKPAGAGITTSLPSTGGSTSVPADQIPNRQADNSSLAGIESAILIGFLIILALLFIWYVGIKIAKELRSH